MDLGNIIYHYFHLSSFQKFRVEVIEMFKEKLCIKRKDIMDRLKERVGETPTNHTYSKFMAVSITTITIHLFTYSFIHSFIRLHIQSLIHLFVHIFIYSFIRIFIHSFIHSFIHIFIYLFIHCITDDCEIIHEFYIFEFFILSYKTIY